ncbi:MAG: phenylacetate--CoA ligase [Planctomycetes bacterium]|nr:phenylacetate--CoA ligase [Planctomycetota bacterium]
MIWSPPLECLPRLDLQRMQAERLAGMVRRVYERVPFYRAILDRRGIKPSAINDLAHLQELPFTQKSDLLHHYPFGLLAVPLSQVVRIHASSGTTGKSTVVAYTRGDLDVWAEVCARCLALSGAKPGQVFQNAYAYGLFTGGLGMHYGAERFGLVVVPVSGGNTARQIMLMQDFGAGVLACTPSYALTLADALEARSNMPEMLRTLILGAEPWTEAMRQELESRWKVQAVNIYGLSEIIGPGVSNECVEAKDGSHICEDHFLVEVIDPKSETVLPDGEVGELTFTTLTKEALPLLRYRTGDLASVTTEPCQCGRTTARMSRIVGRTDDMLIIRGVNVFPSQVEAALVGMQHLSAHHQIVVTRVHHRDELEVRAEVSSAFFADVGAKLFADHANQGVKALHHIEDALKRRLHDALGLSVSVSLQPPGSLPRSEGGKLRRVTDERS